MQAEILAVGSEMLGFARVDTNSLYLTRELAALGIGVRQKMVLPDDREALAEAMAAAVRRSPLVICTGGLGPTQDDRTVEAAAQALGVALVEDRAAVQRLRQRFRQRHWRFEDVQLRQARRLAPAVWLPNRRGTAYGQWCAHDGHVLLLLPGPPPELEAMFAACVRARLARLAPAAAGAVRVLSIAGMGEGTVDALAAPIYRRVRNPVTT
ncbi:MAG: molybdopterin-binding protein, partial [Terriglobales bacterium]